jgi:cell division protein FtsI (penicillin-binding protein 3)
MTWEPQKWMRVRLWLSGGLLVSCFGGLCYRAFELQVRQADHLKAVAEDQYLREIELPPRRGRILDRNGAELAASAEVDSVWANPRQVGDQAPQVAKRLAEVLHSDRKDLEQKLRGKKYFTWLKRRASVEEARAVKTLDIAGIGLAKEPRRYYPNRGLAGPLLGWAGVDSVGQEGMELQFDRWLRGARAQIPGLRDALGREVLVAGVGDVGPQSGHDVYTTIDRYIQFRLEKALQAGVAAHHAKAAVAVALDPRNGEVLAMAAVPTLNPNEPEEAKGRGVRNRAVTDPFEPGSTMKTFTISSAIEAQLVKPGDHWFCENGRFTVGPATIHDAERIGDATTIEVLAKSSNICTAKIAARQGRERLHDILLRFGFGRPTGVDLPGERAGQVRSTQRMGPVETATMSFGQGLTATPLQIAAAYAAISVGGEWHTPHVLRRVVDPSGRPAMEGKWETRRVIDGDVAATMRMMLRAVTQKGGTAERLQLPGYSFAGKTGTAQKVDPVTRHYSTDKWASSFVGFAPAEDPRMVLFVMVDEPQGTHYGSMVAGPVFAEVMADALRWLGVPPDAAPPPEKVLEKVAEKIEDQPAVEKEEDDGFVTPADDPRAQAASEVPDFTGMSIGEAMVAAQRAGLRLVVSGSGYAVAQSPGPGEARRGAACRVQFSPP